MISFGSEMVQCVALYTFTFRENLLTIVLQQLAVDAMVVVVTVCSKVVY